VNSYFAQKTNLIRPIRRVSSPGMTFILALLLWFVMAAVLVGGIVMAMLGKGLWLILLGALAFVILFSKYGCLEGH